MVSNLASDKENKCSMREGKEGRDGDKRGRRIGKKGRRQWVRKRESTQEGYKRQKGERQGMTEFS